MKHTLYVDRKVVTWLRTEIEVEADSLREAVEKFSEPDSWGADVELKNIHELETLRENISPRDNRYNATIEVYVPGHNEPVWNNLDNQFTEPQAKKSDANAA